MKSAKLGIVVAKLVNGETVVGDLKSQDNGILTFKDLLQVGIIPSKDGIGLKIYPCNPFGKLGDIMSINESHVLLWIDEYPKELEGEYLTITKPPSKILVPNTPQFSKF